MPILERVPFRWSQIALPLFYLLLGALIGYVAPILWDSRPGKTEVEAMKSRLGLVTSQLLSEIMVRQFTSVAEIMEDDGLFEIENCDAGLGMTVTDLPDGSSRISQEWQIHLSAPQNDMEKRGQVEKVFLTPLSPNARQWKIKSVTWPDSRTVNVAFAWVLPPQWENYQTTDLLRELRW
jgi:hypothetical protein